MKKKEEMEVVEKVGKVKRAYDEHKRVGLDTGSESMTEQCHADECNINNILRRYDKTGMLTHVNNAIADYGDFSEVNEYKTSLNKIIQAQEAFENLPSAVRKKFGFDPGNYLEFVTNSENKEEMIKLGLANPEVKKEIPEVRIVQDSPIETDG